MSAVAPALSSYVSRLLFDRVASGRPFEGPEARQVHAAVLLSDIKGFTSLVEVFAASGRTGLEELTWVLNAYFADLVEIVYAHGGDVLWVAGDAFFCYWQAASRETLGDATLRAAQAGKAIQARLHERDAGRGRRFATRIGVSAGELTTAFVGGVGGRWELIASGDVLSDVADTERGATPGEVMLSAIAWSLVAARATGRATTGGAAIGGAFALDVIRVPLVPEPQSPRSETAVTTNILRPFAPPSVLDRLAAPQAEWLLERRRVTVLLTGLPELGEVGGDALERIHASVRAFQEVVTRFEGTLRLDVDDKGIMLLAVFGLPPLAHEDDAERAIHAATALHEALEPSGTGGGIGIATGRAFCGAFGSDVRREYMVRGDVINLAARLMRLESGATTCDQATVRAVRGRIAFEALPAVVVSGRSQPVPVFRPSGRVGRPQHADVPVIGRAAERALLAAQLAAFRVGGSGGVVLVEGDAGLGKSRLVADISRNAAEAGVRVLTAAADAIERSTSYYAWRPVFTAVFGLTPDMDSTTARAHVLAQVTALPALQRLVPLLSGVLPVQIPDNELTVEMTGDVRADNTRHLLARILEHGTSSALTLLVVEDAHWLDSNSWALLLDVLATVRPLLTVVASRPPGDPVPADYARLTRSAGEWVIRLGALSPGETAELIAQQLGVGAAPAGLVKLVQDRVAGHPFFCEELVRSMVEAGAVRVVNGTCEVGDLVALDLPTSVEGVILSRLDRLSQGQQLCLKVASVIGRVFLERTVRDTHPVQTERDLVAAHLETLTSLDLTLPEAPEPERAYLFRHVITRDVTYQLMPFAQRKPLHRAVAEWIERAHAADLAPDYGLLAYHWAQAAEPVKTVEYLEKAGQQALRGGAFHEALLFFSQAIEMHKGGGVEAGSSRRALWEKGLGTAHYFLGDLQKSRARFEAAVGLLDRPVPANAGGATRQLLLAAARQMAHRVRPARYLGRRAQEKAALDECVDCYRALGQIYYLDGEPAQRVAYVTMRGLNVGEEAGPSPALARILSNTGTLMGFMGRPKWADWYAHRAIEMAEREGQYAAAAYVWSINSLMQAQRGDWTRARAANAEALRRLQELGDYSVEAEVWVIRATINICEGDFVAAPDAWSHARALAERNANTQILCWSLLDEVDTALGRDDVAGAARALDAALALKTAVTDGSSTIDKQRATAMTRLRQGRHAEAVAAADAVVEMVTRQPPTGYHWVDFCASAVEVYIEVLETRGEFARANRARLERAAWRGCKALGKLSRTFWNVRPRAWLLRGLLLSYHGKNAAALQAFGKAEEIARTMDLPFERARALLEIARRSEAAARESRLAAAGEIFERLGATRFSGVVAATGSPSAP